MTGPTSLSLTVERAFRSDLETRTSQRIVVGRAIPYGQAEVVSDDGLTTYEEEWAHGVFRQALLPANTGRVKLNYTHNDDTDLRYWIGRTLMLDERPDGLYGEWKVDDSPIGDAVLAKVRDGQLPGLSVSAVIVENVMRGGVKVRTKAALRHVALVEQAAFSNALVTAVRERQMPLGQDVQMPAAPVVASGPRPIDEIRSWLATQSRKG